METMAKLVRKKVGYVRSVDKKLLEAGPCGLIRMQGRRQKER